MLHDLGEYEGEVVGAPRFAAMLLVGNIAVSMGKPGAWPPPGGWQGKPSAALTIEPLRTDEARGLAAS